MFFMMIIYFTILFTHILKGNCIQATFSKFQTIIFVCIAFNIASYHGNFSLASINMH